MKTPWRFALLLSLFWSAMTNAQWRPTADFVNGTFKVVAADSEKSFFGIANGHFYQNYQRVGSSFDDAVAIATVSDWYGQPIEFVSTVNHGVFSFDKLSELSTKADSGLFPHEVRAFAVAKHSDGLYLYAGTGDGDTGVYISRNYGAFWQPSNTGLDHTFITALGVQNNTVLAGTELGIYRSSDRGATWQPASTGIFDPPRTVFLSVVNSIVTSGSNFFIGMSHFQNFNSTSDKCGVFLSSDDGQSWTELNNGLTDTNVNALQFAGSRLFAATNSGVFVSTDNGASWAKDSSQYANINIPFGEVYSLAYNGYTLLAGGAGGLYASDSFGRTWSNQMLQAGNSGAIMSLAVTGSTLYAGTNQEATLNNHGHDIFKTTDFGQSWSVAGIGLPDSAIVSSVAANGQEVLAAIGDWSHGHTTGIFHSTNGGDSWSKLQFKEIAGEDSIGLSVSIIKGIDFARTEHHLTGYTYVRRSSDNGLTWKINGAVDVPANVVIDTMIFASDSYEIERSSDSGASWNAGGGILDFSISSLVSVDSTLYAASIDWQGIHRGVYRSTDLGGTWTQLDTIGLPASTGGEEFPQLIAVGKNLFYEGPYHDGGKRGVYLRNDSLGKWVEVGDVGQVNAFAVLGQNLYAATDNAVMYRPLSEMISDVPPAAVTSRTNLESQSIVSYPNPASISVRCRTGLFGGVPATVTVLDLLGRTVMSSAAQNASDFTLDTRSLADGVYAIVIRSERQVARGQFVVAR